jgi:hypothetical protein
VNFTSYSTSPSFQKVILTNNKAIRISFAENIQGPSNCSDLFDETTMLAVGGELSLSFCSLISYQISTSHTFILLAIIKISKCGLKGYTA